MLQKMRLTVSINNMIECSMSFWHYKRSFKSFLLKKNNSFIFSCTSRFVGKFCEYSNPCHTGPGPRCQNGGTCEVTFKESVPGFRCNCPIGFTASLCEIPVKNVCDSGPCQNGGTCNLKSLDEYSCSCSQGYGGKYH